MTGLTRVTVAALQPGDETRPTRTSAPYTVAATTAPHGAWAVTGTDRVTRHYAATARMWRTDRCAGQATIADSLDEVAG